MPKKIQKQTATPPPELALGGRKSPPVEESSSRSIDKILRESTQSPTIQAEGNVQNINQASKRSSRSSALFNNMQNKPRSRSSSPDLESTPRPLRVLKGRKSFLSLNPGVPPRTATSTPQGFKPKPIIQSLDGKSTGPNMPAPRQSPPTRSFLGLRLASPKPRMLSTVNPPPRGNLQVMDAKPKPAEVRFSLGTGLWHPQASNVDLTRQNTMSSSSTVTSSNSIMARTSVPHWMNWRQRSMSDGPSVKAHSILLDKGPSRPIKVVQPSIIYESMRHVDGQLPTLANSMSPRMLRRASSAGPGFFSLEQGISSLKFTRPLTPRPPTQTNIEGSGHVKVDSLGKSGVFSKVLCSIQDMSPLSGNRVPAMSTTTKNHSLEQPPQGKVAEATTQVESTMSRRGSLSERAVPFEALKGKGTIKARGALGSIRRRFGSLSERTLKNTEEDALTLMPNTLQSYFQKEWISPPILQLQLDIHSESSREHVEGGREIWICIEIEGRISNFQVPPGNRLCDGDPWGLDVAIVLDLSAHASPATFEDTKSMAKHLINSLSTIDNVSLTAFTSIQSSPGVETKYPLSRLTQSNKQQLFSFIDGLFGQAERQGTIRRDVKSILMGVIDDLKESTSHEIFNEGGRTGHLFLLTSSLKQGDMPTGAFESSDKRIKVHILGVGPLVTLQERPWKGSWIINLAPSPVNEVSEVSEGTEIFNYLHNRIPTLPRILDSLRHAVNFGELTNIQIGLSPCDGCMIMEVLGDTTLDRLVPGEKRTLFVKLRIGSYNPDSAPGTSMNTPDKNKERQIKLAQRKISVNKALNLKRTQMNDAYDQGNIPEYKLLERQLAATLGDIETRALTVSVSYEHEYFGEETVITTKKVLKVQRYDGDGNWSLSRNPTSSSGEVFEGNPEDCKGSICSTEFLIPPVCQEPSDEYCDEDVEYVRTRLAKKIAEMTLGEAGESPRKALRMVEGLGIRGKGVYAVASELEWRVKIQEEEEETERTMKGLSEEISGKATRNSLAFGERSNSTFSEENMMNSNLDCTPSRRNKLNLHLSSHYQEPGSSNASEIEVNQGEQQKPDIAVRRPRVSSIIIHPVTLPDRPSSPASHSDEFGTSDLDEIHNPDLSEVQSSRRQHDHVDEAGRIWKELAETKMGLRRDIRPGRHRIPTSLPPMPQHSRHNSIDLLRNRHDKEKTADFNWALLSSGRVKGKKKERRRRMKKQAMARRSTEEVGLSVGYQTSMPVETNVTVSMNPRCEDDQEVVSMALVSESKRNNLESLSTLLHDRYGEHNVFVTETLDASMPLASHVRVSAGQAGSDTNNEQSNRDTMKSLITLRDVKETDLSPWAC